MKEFSQAIQSFADACFMPWIAGLLLATGVFLTFRFRFVQITRFADALRTIRPKQQHGASGSLAPFQAFMTALAGSIGTGNIVGVATAIVSGGPGALFWIWVYGFFAMAIKFAEASLGLRFRSVEQGRVLSGPMYYLRDGLHQPALASLFAVVAGLACLFTTPFTQTNSVAVVLDSQLQRVAIDAAPLVLGETSVDLERLMIGVALSVLTWLVIVRGVHRIGNVAARLSPLKVALYLVGGLAVIATHFDRLPEALRLVFSEAFSTQAAVGTAAGVGVWQALRYGIARGVYANEAGYGTAAVAYGTAKSDHPQQQGLHAVLEVFLISFVISTMSAMVVLVTGAWRTGAPGPTAIPAAFNAALPGVGGWMAAASVFLFGYTTLIGWAYFGEQFLRYQFGGRVVSAYRWLYCLLIPLGAVAKSDLVWAWADLLNAMQILPNVIGLLGLSGVAAAYAARGGLAQPREPGSGENAGR